MRNHRRSGPKALLAWWLIEPTVARTAMFFGRTSSLTALVLVSHVRMYSVQGTQLATSKPSADIIENKATVQYIRVLVQSLTPQYGRTCASPVSDGGE